VRLVGGLAGKWGLRNWTWSKKSLGGDFQLRCLIWLLLSGITYLPEQGINWFEKHWVQNNKEMKHFQTLIEGKTQNKI